MNYQFIRALHFRQQVTGNVQQHFMLQMQSYSSHLLPFVLLGASHFLRGVTATLLSGVTPPGLRGEPASRVDL